MKSSRASTLEPEACFSSGRLEETNVLFGAAVDRVAEVEILEAEFILGVNGHRHLFDRARAIVAAGPRDAHRRRAGLARLDEEVLGEADGLALIEAGDVVRAVLLHLDGALIAIVVATGETNLLAVVEDEEAVLQRPIGRSPRDRRECLPAPGGRLPRSSTRSFNPVQLG